MAGQSNYRKDVPFAFSDVQLQMIALFRERMIERHGIDTAGLCDIEMWGRIAILSEIAQRAQWKEVGLFHVLDAYSDKFLDVTALSMEIVMNAEGTRH
jgi:hypothetical protein